MDTGDITTLDVIEAFLLDLYRVYKASFLYPSNHPSLLVMFVKPFNDISPILDGIGEVSVRYKKGEGFSWGDLPVGRKHTVLVEMGEELLKRRIQAVFFLKGLKIVELQSLLKVITADPKTTQDAGGCEKLLEGKGVRHIWFNEIDYKRVLESQKEIREKAQEIVASTEKGEDHGEGIYEFLEPTEERTDAEPLPLDEEVQVSAGKMTIEFKKEEPPVDIDELIKTLNEATSFDDFEKIGNSLLQQVIPLTEGRGRESIHKVMRAFLDIVENRDEKFKLFASEGLNKMVGEKGVLDNLLDRACSKGSEASEAVETLVRLKERAAGQVADRLAIENDSHARHIFSNILVRMGGEIVPQLLERLKDDRWYMVRNMVRILGEIGKDGEVEDALKSVLGHQDPHVRKETVRALSMIRGPQAPSLLRKTLDDSDDSIVELAVVSLGLLRDEGSVQILLNLFEKMGNSDIKREILRALGRIGSKKAVPFISRVFKTKSWIGGKKDDEMKVMCATALAGIGTPDAIKALEEGLNSSREAVRKACEDGLRGIKRG